MLNIIYLQMYNELFPRFRNSASSLGIMLGTFTVPS